MKPIKTLLLALWLLLLVLACNLTGTNAPPTISPRATSTPPPTIGYATLSPEELPQAASTSAPNADVALINLANQIETDRLMLHVDNLQNFGTRHVNSDPNRADWGVGASRQYIRSEFEKIQSDSQGLLVVFEQPFEAEWAGVTTTQANIVAFISGTEAGAGTIVIGAHYDSISVDFEDGSALAPGANDNASGVAALLELARVLSRREYRSSIMFVAFAAEEVNRQGSEAFVQEYLLPRGIDINTMISMDMMGSPTDANGALDDQTMRLYSAGPNDSASRQAARSMELIALNHGTFLSLAMVDRVDREGRYSDHISFSDAGYPAVRLMQSLEDLSRQHNDRDTIDGIQPAYLTRTTQTVLTMITSLADGLRPPTNIALRDAGGGARTLVWEPIVGATSYVVALRWPNSLRYEQNFEVPAPDTSVTWDGFTPDRFEGIAIAAKNAQGLMGPLSGEFTIR